MKSYIVALLFFFSSFSIFAQDYEERFISYDVDIVLNQDRSIIVTEYLKVNAAGDKVKRGIRRNLPRTRILGDHGNQHLQYSIVEILRDNREEKYHIKSNEKYMNIYIGEENIFLEPGVHDYTIKYTVKNQIAFFDSYQELYWNAIGTSNTLTSDKASVKIVLPKEAVLRDESGYQGRLGSREQSHKMVREGNVLRYSLPDGLEEKEGFTVALAIDPGYFQEPNLLEKYGSLITAIASFLILLMYYFFTWSRHGRDPDTPAVDQEYGPPDNLSPGAVAYISRGYVTSKSLTGTIIELVTKAKIALVNLEEKSRYRKQVFQVTNLKNGKDDLSPEQKAFMDAMFITQDQVIIDGSFDPYIQDAQRQHSISLKTQFHKFLTEGNNQMKVLFPTLFTLASAILVLVIYTGSIYTEILTGYAIGLYVALGIIMIILYSWLIRRPSSEKLYTRARIESFRNYLDGKVNPDPEDTRAQEFDHYEKLLPYAIALGVDDKWSKKFEDIFAESSEYRSQFVYYNSFGQQFTRTYSSSSIPPAPAGGSSGGSGSFGGGSSGGGGGGGGAGGW